METTTQAIDNTDQHILWACLRFWETEPVPPEKRAVCYTWVVRPYKARFGGQFHQSKLNHLAKLGFLEKEDTSRGGSRRYYKIVDPTRLKDLLREWSLN